VYCGVSRKKVWQMTHFLANQVCSLDAQSVAYGLWLMAYGLWLMAWTDVGKNLAYMRRIVALN